jgi:ethanolamine utilization protein EutN
MRIAEIIGRVTLSRCHPSLRGAMWRLVTPLNHKGLVGDVSGRGEPFVVYDDMGATEGHKIGVSEGAEAAAPFSPNEKPIDAYAAAILENIEVDAV